MKKGLKNLFIVIFIFLMANYTFGQETKEKSFEEYRKQKQQEFQKYLESENKAYEQYVREEKEQFEKFRKEIEKFWGTGEFKSSTIKDWVEYSEDKKSRSDVDFEKGTAKIEVLLSPEEEMNTELANKKLEEAVKDLVTTTGSTKDFETTSEKPEQLLSEPVLAGQLHTSDGNNVNATNADLFAKEAIRPEKITKKVIKGTDGNTRAKLTISISLAPNHIKVRASKFENEISKYADRYNLAPEIVYAIIHTESFFNPKAISSASAYGLMQLVPKSGARDAYQYVYNQDRILTANYLFQADKNIELGSAYIQLLMKRDFNSVKDTDSRLLCAIAAYNTGAGNVARAFTGNANLNNAIREINQLSYNELYSHLRNNLPYNETKNYIKNVNNRIGMYKEWIN